MFLPTCPKCHTRLSLTAETAELDCPECHTKLELHVFPAAVRESKSTTASERLLSEESSCFFHAAKTATSICEECGRFLCDLCAVQDQGRILCPECLSKSMKHTDAKPITRYDIIAGHLLVLACLPLVGIVPSLVSLLLCLIFFRSQKSAITSPKRKFLIIGVLAFLFLLAHIALAVLLFVISM